MSALDEKIFDTKNVSDLPKDITKKFKCNGFSQETLEMLSFFEIKKILTIDEIVVGFFRKYKKEQSRLWISSTASSLKKIGVLKSIRVGTFELVKTIEDI